MNRKGMGLMTGLVLAAYLTGCSLAGSEVDEASDAAAETVTETPEPTEAVTEEPTPTEKPEPTGPAAHQVWMDAFYTEDDLETADIVGMDPYGEELWVTEAGSYPASDVMQVGEIGLANGYYYYVEGGTVVTLDLRDGSRVWENAEFGGGSPAGVFDEKGTLYLCGYHGPDLLVVDPEGNTLFRREQFHTSYTHPDSLTLEEGVLVIHYEGNQGTLRIDPKTYKLAVPAAPGNGYTDEQLKEMARQFAKASEAEVDVTPRGENEVELYVYYDHPDYYETVAFYWVNPKTGEGEDENGNKIDLRTAITPTPSVTPTIEPEEPEEEYEIIYMEEEVPVE